MYSNNVARASSRDLNCASFCNSCFTVLKKLSTTALSQQLPRRLMLSVIPYPCSLLRNKYYEGRSELAELFNFVEDSQRRKFGKFATSPKNDDRVNWCYMLPFHNLFALCLILCYTCLSNAVGTFS